MNILVVAATAEEIEPSFAFLEENNIPYLITGVGMLSTAYTLSKALRVHNPDLLLQIGIGGILDANATLGAIYQIESDEIFEFGAEDRGNFISIAKLGLGKQRFSERQPIFVKPFPDVPKALGITVNKVHGAEESIAKLRMLYRRPVVESMEGAALFYVAEEENIPALQFRSISNFIEPRNRAAWDIGLAVKNLNVFLQELLAHLR